MQYIVKAGLTTTALAILAGISSPTNAADLGGRDYSGSIKDSGYVVQAAPSVGPCYFRSDAAYGWSRTPDVKWTVTDPNTGDFITDRVTGTSLSNGWSGEVGVGCGSGSRGFRADFTLGYRSARDLHGEPGPWQGVQDDPLHTSITSYTAMVNGYKDLGNWGGFVPYVGAGVGAAYNMMDEVYFTGNPALINRIEGNSKLSLAWSLMAGVGYQLSERAILDVGYRYIDLGSAISGRVDSAGFVNPPVRVTDLGTHEFKVGIRWHFGAGNCCEQPPMK